MRWQLPPALNAGLSIGARHVMMSAFMRIGGYQKCSLVDYPGHVAAVVFTQGCPWRCPWCHNPGLVLPERFGETISEEAFFEWLESRWHLLDGVVVSGGEPTLHADLPDFLRRLRKDMTLKVKLDTSGAFPDRLAQILRKGLVDYVAMDLKAPLEEYAAVAGAPVDTEALRRSIEIVRKSPVPHEFRTTVLPGQHDADALRRIASLAGPGQLLALQRFVPERATDPRWQAMPSPAAGDLEELARICRESGPEVIVRN